MSEELPIVLPCPFCGQIPDLSHNSKPGYVDFVWCHTCGYDMRLDRYNRRVESGELPEWLKEAIEKKIAYFNSDKHNFTLQMRDGLLIGLQWVISLRKEDE